MFCTQCGTQIDEGKKFCKNCGARVGRSSEAPSEAPEPAGSAGLSHDAEVPASAHGTSQTVLRAPVAAPLKQGKSNQSVLIAAAVAVVLLAGAGIYFATGLSKPTTETAPEPPPPIEPIAKAPAEAAPLPSFEDTKDPPPPAEPPSALTNPPSSAEPPANMDVPSPLPAESARRSSPARDALPPAAKTQSPRAAQDTASNRPSAPASRGAANAGVYETLRNTTVYEDPSSSAKVVANIPAGVRVNVVNANGEWLEVHSRRGNPPGFIRRGDAAFVEKSD